MSNRAIPFILALGLPVLWAGTSASQQGQLPAERVVRGFKSCYRCHDRSTSTRILPGGNIVGGDDWILGKECGIWVEQDQHVQAFAVLLNVRSQQIAKIMGVVDAQGKSQVHRDLRCLACHTGYPLEQFPRDEADSTLCSQNALKLLDVNQGVSCEGCHGPSGSGTKPGWYDPHAKADSSSEIAGRWRYLSPRTKLEDYGYVDVRSPFARAKMCAACHVGDAPAGRFVTHEMFAAGHPPLPAFEVEGFLDQMPRHWRSLQEKNQIREGELADDFLNNTGDPNFSRYQSQPSPRAEYVQSFERTRSMVVGQLAVFHQQMQLIANLAVAPKQDWPDMASFDCFACHHELRYPGWRRSHGLSTRPGRPKIHEWPLVFVRFLAHTRDDQAFVAVIADLEAALSARPFGDRSLVSACEKAAEWAERAATHESNVEFDRARAIQLRREIADYCSETTLDYDSARIMVWAFAAVDQELRSPAAGSDHSEPGVVNNVSRSYQEGHLSEPMSRLSAMLGLNVRRRTSERLAVITKTMLDDRELRQVGSLPLGETLPLIDKYEPAEFREIFRALKNTQ